MTRSGEPTNPRRYTWLMGQFEYRVHYVGFDCPLRDRERRLVNELNAVGKEGWRLNRLYPDFKLRTFTSWGGGLNMLLERETD